MVEEQRQAGRPPVTFRDDDVISAPKRRQPPLPRSVSADANAVVGGAAAFRGNAPLPPCDMAKVRHEDCRRLWAAVALRAVCDADGKGLHHGESAATTAAIIGAARLFLSERRLSSPLAHVLQAAGLG